MLRIGALRSCRRSTVSPLSGRTSVPAVTPLWSYKYRNENQSRFKQVLTFSVGLIAASELSKTEEDDIADSAETVGEDPASTTTEEPNSDSDESLPRLLDYKYVLVGGGVASYAALKVLLEKDPGAKILMICGEEHEPYMRPPLSKEVWSPENHFDTGSTFKYSTSKTEDVVRLKFHSQEWYTNRNVDLLRGVKVKQFNATSKMMVLDNPDRTVVTFDQCLLAPGCSPSLPDDLEVDSSAQPYIQNLHTIEQYQDLRASIESKETVAVVGGGLLGAELAASLSKHCSSDNRVIQVVPEEGLLRDLLPPYLSDYLTRKQRENGVEVLCSHKIERVSVLAKEEEKHKPLITLSSGEVLRVDRIVNATGCSPNVDFVAGSLELDYVQGGILVNEELQARSGVFAAGDVASYFDKILGRRRAQQYDHAYESGTLAALNMLGEGKPYQHIPMFWSIIGDIEFYAVGQIDSRLNTVAVWAKPPSMHMKEVHPDWNAEYQRGIVYYLREDNVLVGILLWGIPPEHGLLDAMRSLLYRNRAPYTDINQLKESLILTDWPDSMYKSALKIAGREGNE